MQTPLKTEFNRYLGAIQPTKGQMKMMKLIMDVVLAVSFACLLAACGSGGGGKARIDSPVTPEENVLVPLGGSVTFANPDDMIPLVPLGGSVTFANPDDMIPLVPLGGSVTFANPDDMIPTEDCNCHQNPSNSKNHSTCYIKGIRAEKIRENIDKRSRIVGWNDVEIRRNTHKKAPIRAPGGSIILRTDEVPSYTKIVMKKIVMKYRLTGRIVKYSLSDRDENKTQVDINISRGSGNTNHDLTRLALSMLGCN